MPTPLNVDTDRCFSALATIGGLDAEVVLPGHGEPVRETPEAAVEKARAAGRS